MAVISDLLSRAINLHQAGQLDNAVAIYRKILKKKPSHADALHLLGLVALQKGQAAEAIEIIKRAIKHRPHNAIYLNNLGEAQRIAGKLVEASTSYQKSLELDSSYATAWGNLGFVLHLLSLHADAQVCLERALKIQSHFPDAWNNLGLVAKSQGHLDDAMAYFQQAITQNASFCIAINNAANLMAEQRNYQEAIGLYRKAMALEPSNVMVAMNLLHHQLNIADWDSEMEELAVRVRLAARKGQCDGVSPFSFMSIFSTPEEQRSCAEHWAKKRLDPVAEISSQFQTVPTPSAKDNIVRIGYISPDFRIHPVALLTVGLFEQHDRSCFRIYGYAIGPNDNSPVRQRIEAACDVFRDLSATSVTDAAQTIHNDDIDILVDLAGYTHGARPDILALRPAPIQVGYLGYLGTMGSDVLDYLISDECLTPPGSEIFYSEKLAKLPWYQVNSRELLAPSPSRTSAELPEDALVLCCFNQTMKIQPSVFSIWMDLLRKTPQAILWLLAENQWSKQNLILQAEKAGINSDRLIFAQRVSPEEYYARIQLADIFLDTLPYNAGTTAADAIWAGVPIITIIGDTFSGRMAASVLTAFGMPELITGSLEEYYALAEDLLLHPEKLVSLKKKIAHQRKTATLFNTIAFTRYFENALSQMLERHKTKLPPAHIIVEM